MSKAIIEYADGQVVTFDSLPDDVPKSIRRVLLMEIPHQATK